MHTPTFIHIISSDLGRRQRGHACDRVRDEKLGHLRLRRHQHIAYIHQVNAIYDILIDRVKGLVNPNPLSGLIRYIYISFLPGHWTERACLGREAVPPPPPPPSLYYVYTYIECGVNPIYNRYIYKSLSLYMSVVPGSWTGKPCL